MSAIPTYTDLVASIAENAGADGIYSTRQLPELTLDDIGAFLEHYPAALAEAIADAEPDVSNLCSNRLRNTAKPNSERYANVGVLVVGFIRGYVRGIVLRDVQLKWEDNRRQDAIGQLSARSEERAAVRTGALS